MIYFSNSQFEPKESLFIVAVGDHCLKPNLIGYGVARELTYTGRCMSAEEAQQVQLVNRVFADKKEMIAGVMEIARTIASKSPLTVRGAKHIITYTRDHSAEDSLNYVATWSAAMLRSVDLQEAMTVAMMKRPAEFRD